jgi:hypothetical protein
MHILIGIFKVEQIQNWVTYINVSLIDRLDAEDFKGNGERAVWVERIS